MPRTSSMPFPAACAPRLSSRSRILATIECEIWMEDVAAPEAAWDAARYTRAAQLLGRLAGRSMREGLPDGSPLLFPGLRFIFEGRNLAVELPALRSDETWRHPVMVRVATADPDLRGDLLQLGEEAPDS